MNNRVKQLFSGAVAVTPGAVLAHGGHGELGDWHQLIHALAGFELPMAIATLVVVAGALWLRSRNRGDRAQS